MKLGDFEHLKSTHTPDRGFWQSILELRVFLWGKCRMQLKSTEASQGMGGLTDAKNHGKTHIPHSKT